MPPIKPPAARAGDHAAYVYAREKRADAGNRKGAHDGGGQRIASNIAKLPTLLRKE
jgi:hypothetical protein